MKRSTTVLIIFSFLLSLFSAFVCVWVELLNSECGALPIQERRDGDPANGPVKWRSSIIVDESMWREFVLRSEYPEYEDHATRPLTEAQRQEMEKTVAKALANNRLRDFVGSAGLLQYLLVPTLLILSVVGLLRAGSTRLAFVFPLIVALICGWRMFHLAYFTSLGW